MHAQVLVSLGASRKRYPPGENGTMVRLIRELIRPYLGTLTIVLAAMLV